MTHLWTYRAFLPFVLAVGLFSLALFAVTSISGAESAQSIDRVLVIVNQEVITEFELEKEMQLVQGELRASGQAIASPDTLRAKILEDMILARIQLQVAKDRGIRASEAMLDAAFADIARRNRLSPDRLRAEVERSGIPFADYLDNLRTQLTIRQLIEREIVRQVTVSITEIDEFLAQNPQPATQQPVEVNLEHILVALPGDLVKAEAEIRQAFAVEVRDKIEAGLSFSQAARLYSDSPEAEQGGSLGWRQLSQLPALFVAALEALAPGQVSAVFQSPNGFHLLRLVARRGGTEVLVEQQRVRHILLKANNLLGNERMQERLERIRQRILAGEAFDRMARLHSEDARTRPTGGDLGWLSPGDLPPELESIIERLAIGETSIVAQSRFGWHLAQVTERRTRDLGEEVERQAARQAIRERKIEEQYDQWVRSLRGQAYVHYRVRLGE